MHPQDITTLEEWRPVVGWEDWYEVSDCGRVRRVRTVRGPHIVHLTKLRLDPKGYWRVDLFCPGVRCTVYVHKLVMLAFNGPRPPGLEINHIDGVRTNNHPRNLEYTTHTGNVAHAVALGLMPTGDRHGTHTRPESLVTGEAHHNARLTATAVLQARALRAQGWEFTRIGQHFQVGEATIRDAVARRTWRHI